ncbi:hypothetical protein V6V47_13695 [Micromonospora sp. CPCC 205539]|uniref:hypothetical protein n=1 Tax=Micromonospora sp. CPCC 205539 TaxID=3122408 RepID=UPI002FF1FA78
MCLLTFCPATVMPDLTALLHGADANPHGHGFAIVTGSRIVVEHGMDGPSVIEAFAAARREYPDGPALFHSRLTTHGATSLDNCHPFPVGGDPRTVLAHNGVLPRRVQPGRGDTRSDTRIAVEDFLPRFGSLHLRRNRRRFARWMTVTNAVVVLSVDRRFPQRAYLLNEESGIWDGGRWYSNDSYLPFPLAWADGDDGWSRWGRPIDADDQCGTCGAVADLGETVCRYCGCCVDCGDLPQDCSCSTPAALDERFATRRQAG